MLVLFLYFVLYHIRDSAAPVFFEGTQSRRCELIYFGQTFSGGILGPCIELDHWRYRALGSEAIGVRMAPCHEQVKLVAGDEKSKRSLHSRQLPMRIFAMGDSIYELKTIDEQFAIPFAYS